MSSTLILNFGPEIKEIIEAISMKTADEVSQQMKNEHDRQMTAVKREHTKFLEEIIKQHAEEKKAFEKQCSILSYTITELQSYITKVDTNMKKKDEQIAKLEHKLSDALERIEKLQFDNVLLRSDLQREQQKFAELESKYQKLSDNATIPEEKTVLQKAADFFKKAWMMCQKFLGFGLHQDF